MMECKNCQGTGNECVVDEYGNAAFDLATDCKTCLGEGDVNDDGTPLIDENLRNMLIALDEHGIEPEQVNITIVKTPAPKVIWPTIIINLVIWSVVFLLGSTATALSFSLFDQTVRIAQAVQGGILSVVVGLFVRLVR